MLRFDGIVLGLVIIGSGCATHKHQDVQVKKEKKVQIAPSAKNVEKKSENVEYITQNIDKYVKNFQNQQLTLDQSRYEKHYFKVWNISKPSHTLKNVQWPFETFHYPKGYGANLQLLKPSFYEEMKRKANFEQYGSVNQKALSLKELNLRSFPTDKPLFYNPKLVGEGFPFDYMQNSTLHANKPLFVTHYSKDKEWAHVESSFTYGWVKSDDIVLLKENYTKKWQRAQQVVVVKEGIPLYGKDGEFLFYTKLGMMFALIDETKNDYTLLAVARTKLLQPHFVRVKVSKDVIHKGILPLTQKNLANVLKNLVGKPYGWGGLYGQRDCSSTLRDFYAPFGVWLPRNSHQQAQHGIKIDMSHLSDTEKLETIQIFAKPFQTLLYRKGHIALYAGIVDGKVTILQNLWGIKTKEKQKEGRYVIGKTIFSTLEFGKELTNYDKNSSMLHSLESMNTLF